MKPTFTVVEEGANHTSLVPLTPVQLITALGTVPHPGHEQQDILHLVEHSYAWREQRNKSVMLPYLQAAYLARKHELDGQYKLNVQQVFKALTKDVADGVAKLIDRQMRYKAQFYYRDDALPLVENTFRVLITPTHGPDRFEWVYQPIHLFANLMPLRALQAIELLTDAGMVAQAYWVADKIKVLPTQRLSVDPLLCAQFGRWFLSIAEWV